MDLQATLLQFVNEDLLVGGDLVVEAADEIVLDGTVDSLGVARLVGFVEVTLGVSIPPEDVTIENFRSIDTLAAYLRRRLGSDSAA